MDDSVKMDKERWKSRGLDEFMQRPIPDRPSKAKFIGGANFDALLDDLLFNRMIRLKDLRKVPEGNDPGKMYWDGENKKVKVWVDSTGQWADVPYTTTSTTT
jgi:hypothetical protein